MDSHLHGRTGWFKISSFNVSRTAGRRGRQAKGGGGVERGGGVTFFAEPADLSVRKQASTGELPERKWKTEEGTGG